MQQTKTMTKIFTSTKLILIQVNYNFILPPYITFNINVKVYFKNSSLEENTHIKGHLVLSWNCETWCLTVKKKKDIPFRMTICFLPAGTESSVSRQNACLDAAKFCNVNDSCKRFRSAFISACNPPVEEQCNRRKCHKTLRTFLEKIPSNLTYPLLFCPCKDKPCAERRRQTTVPSCSFNRPELPNCLEIWGTCRQDPVCR